MDCDQLRTLLRTHVQGYKPVNDVMDLAWQQKQEVDSQGALPFAAPVIETKPLPGSAASTDVDASDAAI